MALVVLSSEGRSLTDIYDTQGKGIHDGLWRIKGAGGMCYRVVLVWLNEHASVSQIESA